MQVAVGDIIRLTAVVSMFGQEFVNVHHVIVVVNDTADDAGFMSLVQVIIAPIYANVQNIQSDELRYERLEGQNITQDILLPVTNWVGNPNGDDILNPLPPQVTANVYWPTRLPRVRCTSYLPGAGEDANDADARWTAGAVVDLQAFGDEFMGNLSLGDVTIRKGAYNTALDRFSELIQAVVPPRSRTQKRRRVGVGS